MSNLLELTGEYVELMSLALDPETDEQVLYDTMEAVEGEVGVKMGGYLAVINNLDARANMYDKEADRLKDASKVIKNNIALIHQTIFSIIFAENCFTALLKDFCHTFLSRISSFGISTQTVKLSLVITK